MPAAPSSQPSADFTKNPDYQEYHKFFEDVYKSMDENYYHPITRENFDRFINVFNSKIYSQITGNHEKTSNFVKWRSSAFLVEALKSSDDIFSGFLPPQAAKEYEKSALGKKIDLGIEGKKTPAGYLVSKVEIRSDAYEKGLREKDIIQAIDKVAVTKMTDDQLAEKFNPLEGTKVALSFLSSATKKLTDIEVVSKEYFKQMVWSIPVKVPGIYGIQIQHFNQMTAEDMTSLMVDVIQHQALGLIIDMRGNPGGPPLAAREISAFFLTPKEEFTYFQKKGYPKASLDVPEIPEPYRYHGNIVILTDKQCGSAAELFTGIMKARGRAVLMGTNTAGQVFLKSMFPFPDGSMLLLVTARGHRPDGSVFSYDGLTPDVPVADKNIDLIQYAAEYLAKHVKAADAPSQK